MRYKYSILIGMQALVSFESIPVIPPIIILQIVVIKSIKNYFL